MADSDWKEFAAILEASGVDPKVIRTESEMYDLMEDLWHGATTLQKARAKTWWLNSVRPSIVAPQPVQLLQAHLPSPELAPRPTSKPPRPPAQEKLKEGTEVLPPRPENVAPKPESSAVVAAAASELGIGTLTSAELWKRLDMSSGEEGSDTPTPPPPPPMSALVLSPDTTASTPLSLTAVHPTRDPPKAAESEDDDDGSSHPK